MTNRPITSANLTRRSALAALVGLCGYGGYRWWERRQSDGHWLAEYEAQRALDQPLEKVISIQLGETTLRRWFAEFTRQSGVTVELAVEIVPDVDGRPVENPQRKIRSDMPVWVDLPRLTAAETLDALGTLHGARWRFGGDGVVIFDDRDKAEPLTAEVYPLPLAEVISADEVIDQIKTHVDENSWEELGGNGSVEQSAGALTIVQSRRVHGRTKRFLEKLPVACSRVSSISIAGLSPVDQAWEPIWLEGDDEHWQLLQQALDRPISLSAQDQPWPEFIAALAREARFPLVVHPGVAAVHYELPDWRVTCRLDGVPLRDVLRKARPFDPLEFESLAGGRVLVITTHEGRDGPFPQVVLAHPVYDLTRGTHQEATKQYTDELLELLKSTIEPDSWEDWGAEGKVHSLAAGRLLVVSQTIERQEQVRDLLGALREVKSGARRNVACLPYPSLPVHSREVSARLETPIEFEYCGVQRQKVLEDVFARGGIALPAFPGGRLHVQGPLWCHLPKRPLRENLELLFSGCDYDRYDLHQVLLASEPMVPYVEWAALLVTEVFDLRPWLARRGTYLDAARLLQVLEPDHWEDVGGPGSIQTFRDLLIVRCHPRLMARVRDLLGAVAQHVTPGNQGTWRGRLITGDALNQPLDLVSDTDEERVWERKIAAQNQELATKLERRVSLHVHERNVGEVLLELAREHELPMVVHSLPYEPPRPDPNAPFDPFANQRSLQDLFVSHTVKDRSLVSLHAEDKPLLEVLGALIDPFDYPHKQGWDIKQGCLILGPLTKPMWDETGTFLYTVDDLIAPRGPLLPGQLLRTLEHHLNPTGKKNAPLVLNSYLEFQLGNLLTLHNAADEPARTIVEQTLRDLRSGKLKPLPVEKGDSDFSVPYYPPGLFRPFVTGPIPVVG